MLTGWCLLTCVKDHQQVETCRHSVVIVDVIDFVYRFDTGVVAVNPPTPVPGQMS